jgi:hypothetical protein
MKLMLNEIFVESNLTSADNGKVRYKCEYADRAK